MVHDHRTRCIRTVHEAITDAVARVLTELPLLFVLSRGRLRAFEHAVPLGAASRLVVDYAVAGRASASQYQSLRQEIAGHGAK